MSFSGVSVTKRAVVAVAIALGQLVTLSPQPVFAADTAVRIAGQSVFSIPVGSGKITAQSRAETVQQNLDNALVAATNRAPSTVKIVYVKGVPVITVAGYKIVTVDAATAKAKGTTPAVLAKRWADGIKQSLADSASVREYVAQLTGATSGAEEIPHAPSLASPATSYAPPANNYPPPAGSYAPPSNSYAPPVTQTTPMRQGRVVYVPAGMVIPVTLTTGISSELAQPGDRVEATVNQTISLENGQIPAGSIVVGQVVESEAGKRLGRSGELNFKFVSLRTPDGSETPITAHLTGAIGKYSEVGGDMSDTVKGETTKNKIQQTAIQGAIGAGAGALVGTAIGAIAGGGHGVGRGAWSGAAIGGGLGVANALLLRKGANVVLKSGERLQLQLDAPAQIAGTTSGNL